MIISCLQMPVIIGGFTENTAALRRMMKTAMEGSDGKRPDVILLPELWDIGFYPRPLAENLADNPQGVMAELAKEYGVNIVGGSVAVKEADGSIANACFVYDRSGTCIARYDKTHRFSPSREDKHFAKGDHLGRFMLDGVPCAVVICYDLRFFELLGTACRGNGGDFPRADVLFLPTQWPEVRREHWQILTRARAIENQVYLCGCNAKGGFSPKVPLCGCTEIIGPWGDILAQEPTDEEAIVTAEIEIEKLAEVRKALPVMDDRRPELYSI